MPLFNLFSKRQKRARGEFPDVYTYDEVPNALRVQIVHIVRDTFGREDRTYGNQVTEAYNAIHRALCREYSMFKLGGPHDPDSESIFNFFLQAEDHETALDIVEICFSAIDNVVREDKYQWNEDTDQLPDDAINELNARFKEHGIGYAFESGQIIRIDSQFTHAEVVKPTLLLLSNNRMFAGANDEFLSAHKHYRHGKYKECINDCLKSFESTLKAICVAQKWPVDANATSKKLIDSCISNGLVPAYMNSQLSSIRTLLESGIPTIRNKNTGHGQGTIPTTVPQSLASFALHLTAANILFLSERDSELNP